MQVIQRAAQFVIRYEMSNQVHDSISIPISYVVSNASAYTYVDDMRPTSTALPKTVAAAAPGFRPTGPAEPPPAFVPYADAKNCVGYDHWPYGLKDCIGYASRPTDNEIKNSLPLRRPPICSAKRTSCLLAFSTLHARQWPKAPRV